MWAQDWSSIYDLVVPFSNVNSTDLTQLLLQNNFTALTMFKVKFTLKK